MRGKAVAPGIRSILGVILVAGALLLPADPVSAASCGSWYPQPPNPGSHSNELRGVATTSPCNAWAVGDESNGSAQETMVLHWNGHSWKRQSAPNPGTGNGGTLEDVAALSGSNAWAVGAFDDGSTFRTLILHWNGHAWKRQPSPSPGTNDFLGGVTATSPSNAWAVGSYSHGSTDETLILHWNGTAWKRKASPNPSNSANYLNDVIATSGSNAWIAGQYIGGSGYKSFILHWNGIAWKRQKSPEPGDSNYLKGLAATSKSDAWAVGYYFDGSANRTLILHWNGGSWKRKSSPNSEPSSFLNGVVATGPSDAWAVGYHNAISAPTERTLVLHWNGRAWSQQPSTNLSNGPNYLKSVDATSPSNVWAVGDYNFGSTSLNLALHCC